MQDARCKTVVCCCKMQVLLQHKLLRLYSVLMQDARCKMQDRSVLMQDASAAATYTLLSYTTTNVYAKF